ncbi:hypothetical protein AB4Y96_18385 [Phyllobacterium sp. TAF24]|uniref:hypothetical protein n=1 Tax=Phyllobacterium sp. TAF24 TaxID=3233068 RepID=UPI003F99BBD0
MLSIFIGNDGPGLAVISPTVLCQVWMGLPLGVATNNSQEAAKSEKWMRFVFNVTGGKSFILKPGTHQMLELKGRPRDELISETLYTPTKEGSSCAFLYKHQNGKDAVIIEDIQYRLPFLVWASKSSTVVTTPSR